MPALSMRCTWEQSRMMRGRSDCSNGRNSARNALPSEWSRFSGTSITITGLRQAFQLPRIFDSSMHGFGAEPAAGCNSVTAWFGFRRLKSIPFFTRCQSLAAGDFKPGCSPAISSVSDLNRHIAFQTQKHISFNNGVTYVHTDPDESVLQDRTVSSLITVPYSTRQHSFSTLLKRVINVSCITFDARPM